MAWRYEHVNGSLLPTLRADQAVADKILQDDPTRHTLKANFVWDPPTKSSRRCCAWLCRQRLAALGHLDGINRVPTRSASITPAVAAGADRVAGLRRAHWPAPGVRRGRAAKGATRATSTQFNDRILGPLAVTSTGLESGTNYRGCSQPDLVARNIRMPKAGTSSCGSTCSTR